MLQRRLFPSGIVAYISPLLESLDVRHAFSTRLGGISPPPFASMNLGNPNGCEIQDDYERIWENYRRLQDAAGMNEQRPCRVHQVHGKTIARIMRGEAFDNSAQADAIVSDDPARVISVRVADCVPVLLAGPGGQTVAAVHAGWRGVVAEIVAAALRDMHDDPRECVAAIGPCISMDAFEVGEEVLEEFERLFHAGAPARRRANGKGHVDLREAVRRQLISAGISPEQIDLTDRCTFRDGEEFYSHRRDNGITGRMAALIQASSR